MKRLLALLLISTRLHAEVILLKKDQPAPFEGFLFDREAERDNRKSLLDLEVYKQLDASKQKLLDFQKSQIEITNQQVVLYQNQSQELSKRLVEVENSSFWKSFLWFALGAAVTTAIAFGVNQATK